MWSKLAQPRAAFSWIIEVWIVQDRYHCFWLSKDGGQEECKEHDLQKHVAQPEGNANSKNGQTLDKENLLGTATLASQSPQVPKFKMLSCLENEDWHNYIMCTPVMKLLFEEINKPNLDQSTC